MPVQINLAPETERVLREQAGKNGRTLEAYLEEIVDRVAREVNGGPGLSINQADFERALDELSEGLPSLPSLPPDFSRVDIYGEHP